MIILIIIRQGNDRGTQYRSGIYYHNDEQKVIGGIVYVKQDHSTQFLKIASDRTLPITSSRRCSPSTRTRSWWRWWRRTSESRNSWRLNYIQCCHAQVLASRGLPPEVSWEGRPGSQEGVPGPHQVLRLDGARGGGVQHWYWYSIISLHHPAAAALVLLTLHAPTHSIISNI